MVQRIYRKKDVQKLYGNPPQSTFDYWISTGRVPRPNVQLGSQTPGWTEDLIERDQAARITHRQPPENTA
jgi:predicted DNA-binding transcriptional regulator AlpA